MSERTVIYQSQHDDQGDQIQDEHCKQANSVASDSFWISHREGEEPENSIGNLLKGSVAY
jgi:hypothetical protein